MLNCKNGNNGNINEKHEKIDFLKSASPEAFKSFSEGFYSRRGYDSDKTLRITVLR